MGCHVAYGMQLSLSNVYCVFLSFPYLLAAVNTVQSLLQLSKGVALQTLGSFLRDRGQWLAQQALGGLGQRAGWRMGLTLGLGLSAERSEGS